MKQRVGFMQGRFSPLVDGRIQAFPWSCWQDEFALAERHGFRLMEWTLDQERLLENPLLTSTGQARIRELGRAHSLAIPSLTGDCFMQAPFWKAAGEQRAALQRDFLAIAAACGRLEIGIIVVPLVDNGRLNTPTEQDCLLSFLRAQAGVLAQWGVRVAFESDLGPEPLRDFMAMLPADTFGINYDIGNSASLGFDPVAELSAYGERILNVHVKDRVRGGTTVPLGQGGADFGRVFAALGRIGYSGNYILQTARADDGNHAAVLARYRDMTVDWMKAHGA
jgi:L-ribulose-5-phosphate 3-epimerase